ncbi:hypothetical protein E2C01_086751 [Portunus trituberculatus]|uniref:Uncharacterized protein n=1 Tax=Portunus trituberculatus TaxID=210409 RepID=A0A5B7JAK5_PORTR|nr:hypothetical protein [Portunus trituberculatus]
MLPLFYDNYHIGSIAEFMENVPEAQRVSEVETLVLWDGHVDGLVTVTSGGPCSSTSDDVISESYSKEILDVTGRRGTVEPYLLWGPRGLQAHGFESCSRSECRLGFLTRSNGFLTVGL